jgi:Flp pilus assembly protein TadD
MDDPISLSAHLLRKALHLLQMGRAGDARQCLHRLVDMASVCSSVRAEGHGILGQLELDGRRFRAARRHFVAAIRLRRHDAAAYARYAAAVEADPDADPNRGVAALRRAVGIQPFEPRYWTALGRAATRAGERRQAVRAFRRAARLQADDRTCLAEVVDGFLSLGRGREAARVIQAARFQAPNDARLAQLANRVRFDRLRRRQDAGRPSGTEAGVILTFPGRTDVSATGATGRTLVRVDRASRPTPHLLRMPGYRPGPRQAQ